MRLHVQQVRNLSCNSVLPSPKSSGSRNRYSFDAPRGDFAKSFPIFPHFKIFYMILLIHLVSTKKFPSYNWFVCNLIGHHSHNTTSTKWHNLVTEWKECHEMWQWKFGKNFWLMRSTRSWSKQLIVSRIAVSLSCMTSSCVRVSWKIVTTIFETLFLPCVQHQNWPAVGIMASKCPHFVQVPHEESTNPKIIQAFQINPTWK